MRYSMEEYNKLDDLSKQLFERSAEKMALDINGGSWDKDYTEAQKNGWRLKAWWCFNYCVDG